MWHRFKKPKRFAYTCSHCGQIHEGAPSFAFARPRQTYNIPSEEFENRVYLTSDLCVIDEENFYIRCTLEIPIIGSDDPFVWGIWVTQSQESFNNYVETYNLDQSDKSSFGWLPVDMKVYLDADTPTNIQHLKSEVRWGTAGQRPTVHIHDDEDHPLARDQRDGISWDRAIELAGRMLHSD